MKDAGWSVVDVLYALDHLPDGRAQGFVSEGEWVPLPGADTIAEDRIPHWISFRLNHWRDAAGHPVESHTQMLERRQAAREVQEAAQRRAIAERQAQRRRLRHDPAATEARREAMAAVRSLPRTHRV
ncbi:hypothetical protein GSY69_11000 [Brevibacterium sp. 5221]|uniref:Uncharacterized protein n=1 Tax=Brevibacterium rongguiense TaxID=2695267 RepID=A0A6N9H8W7_9MICO|nr:hypothetical protein [Brevibacterium rongguiense]MYM20477.1 hypothetical protein [Brevibacterium rongguiense]